MTDAMMLRARPHSLELAKPSRPQVVRIHYSAAALRPKPWKLPQCLKRRCIAPMPISLAPSGL